MESHEHKRRKDGGIANALFLLQNPAKDKSPTQQFFRIRCRQRENEEKNNPILMVCLNGIHRNFAVFKIINQESLYCKKESKPEANIRTFKKVFEGQAQRFEGSLFIIGYVPGNRNHKNKGLKNKLIRPLGKSDVVAI